MLDLSPTKLIIILIVAVVLLGPKRLPEVARQLGAMWSKVRAFHQRVDQELRRSMPDLPSSGDIARFARSPLSLLDQLADRSGGTISPSSDGSSGSNAASGEVDAAVAGAAVAGAAVAGAAGAGTSAAGAVTAGASAAGETPGPLEDLPASPSLAALFLVGTDDPHLN